MTARAANKLMYVMLDFEGMGSFEQTEQEDMSNNEFKNLMCNNNMYYCLLCL